MNTHTHVHARGRTYVLYSLAALVGLAACAHDGLTTPAPFDATTWVGPRFLTTPETTTGARPLLLLFALDADTTLHGADTPRQPAYHTIADPLVAQGWLIASLDMPAHGEDRRPGEPDNALLAWAQRLQAGEPLVSTFTETVSALLNHLIAIGRVDPNRIAAAGISRGGFLALHAAAADPRIRAVVGLSPVTDLRALAEFAALQEDPYVGSLRLHEQTSLRATAIWLAMAEDDTRVSTSSGAAFAAGVGASWHTYPGTAHAVPVPLIVEGAAWLLR